MWTQEVREAGPVRAPGGKCPQKSGWAAGGTDVLRGGDRRANEETGELGREEQQCCRQERGGPS